MAQWPVQAWKGAVDKSYAYQFDTPVLPTFSDWEESDYATVSCVCRNAHDKYKLW